MTETGEEEVLTLFLLFLDCSRLLNSALFCILVMFTFLYSETKHSVTTSSEEYRGRIFGGSFVHAMPGEQNRHGAQGL